MINTGSSEMITLPSGGSVRSCRPTWTPPTRPSEVLAFFDTLEVPHLFVFEHPTTYGDNQPQGDYALLDKGAQMSDEIVSRLRQGGAAVLDSRDILAGENLSRIVMRTDQHWTYYAALRVARAVAAEIGLDASLLETDQFEVRLYPQKFMGKYGQKIGPGNIDPDDIEIFWPKYETAITRTTVYDKNDAPYEISGEFKDSMIKWEYLYGDSWNIEAYKCSRADGGAGAFPQRKRPGKAHPHFQGFLRRAGGPLPVPCGQRRVSGGPAQKRLSGQLLRGSVSAGSGDRFLQPADALRQSLRHDGRLLIFTHGAKGFSPVCRKA